MSNLEEVLVIKSEDVQNLVRAVKSESGEDYIRLLWEVIDWASSLRNSAGEPGSVRVSAPYPGALNVLFIDIVGISLTDNEILDKIVIDGISGAEVGDLTYNPGIGLNSLFGMSDVFQVASGTKKSQVDIQFSLRPEEVFIERLESDVTLSERSEVDWTNIGVYIADGDPFKEVLQGYFFMVTELHKPSPTLDLQFHGFGLPQE